MQTWKREEAESPHHFRFLVGVPKRHQDPKGLGTQPQPMTSRRPLNSEVSHSPGGVGLEQGTKSVGRSDLAHPRITDGDPSGSQSKFIASPRVITLYQSLYLLGIKTGWGEDRGRERKQAVKAFVCSKIILLGSWSYWLTNGAERDLVGSLHSFPSLWCWNLQHLR